MAKRFLYPVTVSSEDIDRLNHVNNEVYLSYLMNAASAHSESVGYHLKKLVEGGAVFVVRRHEIDYLSPAFLGDELSIYTWVSERIGAKSFREFQIIRNSDQKIIMQAKTLFVYVSLVTGKPTSIPDELIKVFMDDAVIDEQK